MKAFFNTSWIVQQRTVAVCLGAGLISKMDKHRLGLSAVVKSSLWVLWWQFLCKFYIFPEIGPYLLFAELR